MALGMQAEMHGAGSQCLQVIGILWISLCELKTASM
jgi:hypothetical protein